MATRHDIVFEIDENGDITIRVEGVKGKDCVKLTRELEEALGLVKSRQYTSEYYQQEEAAEERAKVTLGVDAGGES